MNQSEQHTEALDTTNDPREIREAFSSPGGKTYQFIDGELVQVDDGDMKQEKSNA